MFQTESFVLEGRKASIFKRSLLYFSIRQILTQLIAYLTLDRKCFPYQYFDVYRKLWLMIELSDFKVRENLSPPKRKT